MLTAKLTGCTFVVRRNDKGVIEATHLQPNSKLDGKTLHKSMQKDHGKSAYGKLKYDIDKRSINVIGIRKGTTWEVWVQKIEKHQLTIRSVHKIFPA